MKKIILLTISVFCLLIVNGQFTTSTGYPLTIKSSGKVIYGNITYDYNFFDKADTSIKFGRYPFIHHRCHCCTCQWYKGDKGKIDTPNIDPFRSYYIENLGYEKEDIGGIKTTFRGRHSLDSIYTEKFGGMVNKK